MLGQPIAQKFEALFRRVHDLEKFQALRGNGSRVHHGLEVNQAVPILAAINDDQNLLGQFLCLRESENLEKLVEGPEAARENHQRLGQIREPELAHEEVMEFEIQRWSDMRIGHLLEG